MQREDVQRNRGKLAYYNGKKCYVVFESIGFSKTYKQNMTQPFTYSFILISYHKNLKKAFKVGINDISYEQKKTK